MLITLFDIDVEYTEFYVKEYHGTMGEAAFDSVLPDAMAEVDCAVWPYVDLTPYEYKVKMAICAVADIMGNPKLRRKSYSAGKVSETLGNAGFSLTSTAAIKRWLGNTGVLKKGRWI